MEDILFLSHERAHVTRSVQVRTLHVLGTAGKGRRGPGAVLSGQPRRLLATPQVEVQHRYACDCTVCPREMKEVNPPVGCACACTFTCTFASTVCPHIFTSTFTFICACASDVARSTVADCDRAPAGTVPGTGRGADGADAPGRGARVLVLGRLPRLAAERRSTYIDEDMRRCRVVYSPIPVYDSVCERGSLSAMIAAVWPFLVYDLLPVPVTGFRLLWRRARVATSPPRGPGTRRPVPPRRALQRNRQPPPPLIGRSRYTVFPFSFASGPAFPAGYHYFWYSCCPLSLFLNLSLCCGIDWSLLTLCQK